MPNATNKLKLGKGAAFVKSQLRRLPQNDDVWEVGFGPIDKDETWLGLVVSPPSGAILASELCENTPTINDLAALIAHAMRRPGFGSSSRPKLVRIRSDPAWSDLLPHLSEIGIEVETVKRLKECQTALREFRQQLRSAPATQAVGEIERAFPAIAEWVYGCGWIEIGDQESIGFVVRALDCGGMVYEDTKCRTFAEAMASLEKGLAAALQELAIWDE